MITIVWIALLGRAPRGRNPTQAQAHVRCRPIGGADLRRPRRLPGGRGIQLKHYRRSRHLSRHWRVDPDTAARLWLCCLSIVDRGAEPTLLGHALLVTPHHLRGAAPSHGSDLGCLTTADVLQATSSAPWVQAAAACRFPANRARRRPESNRCTRLCRPLRSHSATSPQPPSLAPRLITNMPRRARPRCRTDRGRCARRAPRGPRS
jgi:hypothetical protein